MKCPVCDKLLINQGALCCPECKETLIGMMQNHERICESDNEQNVFLAYSLMKDWSLFQHVESLYGNKQSFLLIFQPSNSKITLFLKPLRNITKSRKIGLMILNFTKKRLNIL